MDGCPGRERHHSSQVIVGVALPFRCAPTSVIGVTEARATVVQISPPHKTNLAATMTPNTLLVFALISLSACADSLGFIHAARIWQKDAISWIDVAWSTTAWSVGIMLYVMSLRFLTRLGVTAAEIHTMVWFAMTIVGVIVFSGRFFAWPRLEQGVATLLLVGLGWLLVRTAE
jgi:hypothetical protein